MYPKLLLCLICLAFSFAGRAQKLHVAADTSFENYRIKVNDTILSTKKAVIQYSPDGIDTVWQYDKVRIRVRTETRKRVILKYGLRDEQGNWLVPPLYSKAEQRSHHFVMVKKVLEEELYTIVDSLGNQSGPFKHIMSFNSYYIIYKGGTKIEKFPWVKGGKCGLANHYGKVLIAPVFDYMRPHQNGAILTVIGGRPDKKLWKWEGGKCGLISSKGETILENEYAYIQGSDQYWDFKQDQPLPFITVNIGGVKKQGYGGEITVGGRWGLLNRRYEWITPAQYASVAWMGGGYVMFNQGGIQKPSMQKLGYGWGVKSYVENGHWGIMDTNGKLRVPCIYTLLRAKGIPNYGPYNNHVLIASKEPRKHYVQYEADEINLGLVDYEGRELTPFIYSRLELDDDNFGKILACKGEFKNMQGWNSNNSCGYLDSSGKEITGFTYSVLYSPYGFPYIQYAININGSLLWGLMDHNTKHVTAALYKDMHDERWQKVYRVSDTLGHWGLMDLYGKPLTELKYKRIHSIDSCYFLVETDAGCNILNTSGREMFKEWTSAPACFNSDGYLVKQVNGRWGALNHLGDTVMPFDFENYKLLPERTKILLVRSNGKWGVFDLSRQVMIVLPEYDTLEARIRIKKESPYRYIVLSGMRNGYRCKLKEDMGRWGIGPSYFQPF